MPKEANSVKESIFESKIDSLFFKLIKTVFPFLIGKLDPKSRTTKKMRELRLLIQIPLAALVVVVLHIVSDDRL